ncbi:XdhC family protein [Paraburkholderia sp. BCC1885]|uniref:XdhC family protein n=1 Tax=Paraburkholderia sp. BCC1885 TaxID=2562669 RepID=UPI0028CB24BE|nr:XdhC family protein [Paraburkholderia sp. BCC1885]
MNSATGSAINSDELIQLEQRLTEEARLFAVTTVIRALPPTSTWVGAQAVVESDGTLHGWIGGGCSRSIVVQAAQESMRSGQPKLIRISNSEVAPEPGVEHHAMPCASNGTIELFIQPSVPAPAVLILGSAPAALEACVLAQRMGLRVHAAASVTEPFAPLGIPRVIQGFDADTLRLLKPQLILVATQGERDEEALEAALRTSAAAVLLIASQRKADQLRDTMRVRGIPEERLAALHAPAGPHIHARTPQEIALGAVAGLVTLRRTLEQAAADTTDLHAAGADVLPVLPAVPPCEAMASVEPPARYVNPVCGMAVDIASARHVVEAGGQRVYFCCDGCKLEFERAPDKYLAIVEDRRQREVV